MDWTLVPCNPQNPPNECPAISANQYRGNLQAARNTNRNMNSLGARDDSNQTNSITNEASALRLKSLGRDHTYAFSQGSNKDNLHDFPIEYYIDKGWHALSLIAPLPTAPIPVPELILSSRNEAHPDKAEDPMNSTDEGMSIRSVTRSPGIP
jgi:hypothetical protein